MLEVVNTIPYGCRSQVPMGPAAQADSRQDSWTGSKHFQVEVNIWMWKDGRPFPRKFSVVEAAAMRKMQVQESRARGAATLQVQRRREAAAKKMGVQEQ